MRIPVSPPRFIAIALPLLSEGEIDLVQGVRHSLNLSAQLEVLVLSGAYESSLRKLANSGELAGAIGEFMSPIWLKELIEKRVPVVQLGEQGNAGFSSVSPDFSSMGLEAVEVFLQNSVKSLAYLGASGPSGSARLGSAFAEQALNRGHTVMSSSDFSPSLLRDFLFSLPCPAGLLCATDRLAHLAALTARELGLRIPQDLSLIGVGNSRMESLHAGIPLSSFDLNPREMGRQAGKLLTNLIQSRKEKPLSLQIKARLHERDSSLRSTSGIARTLAYLSSNPSSTLNAGELARQAGMSRRSFELSFVKECGMPPGAYLKELRRQRAEELLQAGELGISEIAQACGYQDLSVFSAAFKKWTGKSPRDFRKSSME